MKLTWNLFWILCYTASIEANVKVSSDSELTPSVLDIYHSSTELLDTFSASRPKLIRFLRWWYRH